MIKDRNIADDAQIQVHKILGSAGMFLTGELFWVGNGGDAAYNAMRAKVPADRISTDLDTVMAACVANRGDVVVCMEGYSKAVVAAAGLALDVAGVTIIFLGTGTSQAYINFTTDVGADMDVDAADITLINPRFVAGIDSLTGPIDINATDFTILNGKYEDASNIETIDCVIATAGATRLKIDGWVYKSVTETGDLKQSNIQLNGCDDIILKNIDVRGDFYAGNIENVTDEVLNARFEDVYLENLNQTPTPAMVIDANATGSCKNVKMKIYSGSTYYSNAGKLSWDNNCEGFMGDGVAGDPLGTVAASGLEGQVSQAVSEIGSVGVKTSTILSEIGSNYAKVSAGVSGVASEVVSTFTKVSAGVSGGTSEVGSVGTKVSTALSEIGSNYAKVSAGVSGAASEVGSVGTKVSTALSEIGSNYAKVSAGVSGGSSEVGSVGTKVSTALSEIGSNYAKVSAGVSGASSEVGSVGTKVSTALSEIGSNYAKVSAGVSLVASEAVSIYKLISAKLSVIDSQVT